MYKWTPNQMQPRFSDACIWSWWTVKLGLGSLSCKPSRKTFMKNEKKIIKPYPSHIPQVHMCKYCDGCTSGMSGKSVEKLLSQGWIISHQRPKNWKLKKVKGIIWRLNIQGFFRNKLKTVLMLASGSHFGYHDMMHMTGNTWSLNIYQGWAGPFLGLPLSSSTILDFPDREWSIMIAK